LIAENCELADNGIIPLNLYYMARAFVLEWTVTFQQNERIPACFALLCQGRPALSKISTAAHRRNTCLDMGRQMGISHSFEPVRTFLLERFLSALRIFTKSTGRLCVFALRLPGGRLREKCLGGQRMLNDEQAQLLTTAIGSAE
jgi:hypothetical protein